MIKLKIYFIATICGLFLTASCSKEDTAPTVSDQETAEQFAWAVKTSVKSAAPSDDNKTWSNATVSGTESGSAVVNDDSYYPHLTGTVIIDGTCTTQYGWNTEYWGQWELVGEDLKLSGKLSGTASIAMIFKEGGLYWAAMVKTADGTWSISN